MTPQLLIFLVAVIYLSWTLVRFFKRRTQKHTPFIEVLEEEHQDEKPPQAKPEKIDEDSEWRRRVRAEIEEMTK